MKKLMTLAAVGLLAMSSQAFSVQWGALNVLTPEATDPKVSQTGIIGAGAAMSGLDITVYWISSTGDQLVGVFQSDAGKVSAQNLSSAFADAMLADQGSSWKPQYHVTATYTTADGVYTFDGTATASQALSALSTKNVAATANFKAAGTWDYKANAVPEPTSGLLLLLGVAGLALRRRRA